jgi:type 1 glutamine amidotransferase
MTPSDAARAAIARHVRGGGGLLALHTASICFDDWPGWGEVLGARWRWGQSFHPPPQQAQVHVADAEHPICAGVTDFELEDEVFHDLEHTDDNHALLSASAGSDGRPQPVLWARRHGAGRVVYDALGHTVSSLQHPCHRRLLRQATQWLIPGFSGVSS